MTDIDLLTATLGALVGFSLGLTGGGGSIFAVPLLVYALGVPAREAVSLSMLTVGVTAFIGFALRAQRGMVEYPTGLLFAVAGMVGAPVGTKFAKYIPESVLLATFALLMITIAVGMWRKKSSDSDFVLNAQDDNSGPICRRDPDGKLRITSRCGMLLGCTGFTAGVLSGVFGVGGGFIIVPALVSFACMGMQRAIGTSLLVITLVSVAATVGHIFSGTQISLAIATVFTSGSVLGLLIGTWWAQRLAGLTLQRLFAAAILLVAIYIIFRTIVLS